MLLPDMAPPSSDTARGSMAPTVMGQAPEHSSPRPWTAPPHPYIYEINSWPWLARIAAEEGHPVTLGTVPDRHLDAIAEMGVDAVWLMGVWERSPAGLAIALRNPDLVAEFEAALPRIQPDDVVGAAYCIRDYTGDVRLGGPVGLRAARDALDNRGMGLILDFVPNHVA